MRIGISALMIQRGQTGVAQYLFALLRALVKAGEQHQFVLFVLEADVARFDFLGQGVTKIAVPEKYRAAVPNIRWHHQYLPALVREHRLEVLHIPSYRRLLWRRSCPLVATIHDLAPFHVPRKYDWKRMFYGRVVVRRLARRQDRIIAVSHNTARDLVRFFHLPESRIQVIHNGIDHERFCPGPAAEAKAGAARKHGLLRPYFLYVARLEHPGKNHLRLISAFERVKQATGSDWQLVFGGSDWHGAEFIHAAIQGSVYREDIRALGFVPDNDLPELYRAAETLVYPSLYEGFGFPPLEAMACGCPVICSTCGSLGEVIGDAALTIDPLAVEDLANKLTLVARDPETRLRLGAAGLEQARRFDWGRAAVDTLKTYEQVVAAAGRLQFVRGSAAAVRY